MRNPPQQCATTWPFFLLTFATFLTLVFIVVNLRTNQITTNTSIELNIIGGKAATSLKSFNLNCAKKRVHIPKFMLELYEQNKKSEWTESVNFPDIVRSVIPVRANSLRNKLRNNAENRHILEFNLPSTKQDEKFVGAELKILTLVDFQLFLGVGQHVKVYLYDISEEKLKILHQLHLNCPNNTWISFNLTKSVENLLKQTAYAKLRIILSIREIFSKSNNGVPSLKLSLLPHVENFQHDYPVLLLSYISLRSANYTKSIKQRQKRHIEDDYEEETNKIWDNEMLNKAQAKKLKRMKNACRKKHLYVDFSEIQYDSWIVQPSGYEAYQCIGKCFYPVAEHLSPTKHAIVQSLLHSVAPSRALRSCCVPTKLNAISLLYIDDKGVLTYRYGYDDMVVEECGCR